MKKKILVVFTGAMEIGGIERSLLGLLEAIDYSKYDVDLFLYGHHGPLFSMIDKRVNILPETKELAYLRESFVTKLKNGCYYSAIMRVVDVIKSKFISVNHDLTWAKIMRKCAPKIECHYDLAISFFRPFDFIIEKVNADVKIGWVHTDYSNAGEELETLEKDYSRMDYIAAVSRQCAESFIKIFPNLRNKVITIENILSASYIWKEAEKENVISEMPDDGSIKILSVGRFCEAKNFDNIPEICYLLRKLGVNVKWYIIGYGRDEKLIRTRIVEFKMQDYVIILGKKNNPYPYMKQCDVYCQPSRYEGKCVAVIEAQILHKPVIITKYATSASQLKNGYDGVIVPMDTSQCARGIAKVIQSNEVLEMLRENTFKTNYTNIDEIQKVYQLIR